MLISTPQYTGLSCSRSILSEQHSGPLRWVLWSDAKLHQYSILLVEALALELAPVPELCEEATLSL